MSENKLTPRQYLQQLENINEIIQQDLERLNEIKQKAESIGGIDYSKEQIQAGSKGDKVCNDVIKIVTLNDFVNAEIDRFINAREQIIREIRGLRSTKHNIILYKVYVQFKSIRSAADEMHISYGYAREIHKQALDAFDKQYTDLKYLR